MKRSVLPLLMLPDSTDRHALLRAAARMLPGGSPQLDAELLLAAVLGEERLIMLAGDSPVTIAQLQRFSSLLHRRQAYEPVAYILGAREFWSLPIGVTPDVLIPRPDSETLIAAAVAHFAAVRRTPQYILDLGTGSGALLLAALSEWPQAHGVGIDQSVAALAVANRNAANLGMAGRADFRPGDWGHGLTQRFDLLLCNPPYVRDGDDLPPDVEQFEPAAALYAGADGLDCYRCILPQLPSLLNADGIALIEFGFGQEQALCAMAQEDHRSLVVQTVHVDLGGRPRVLELRLASPSVGRGLGKAGDNV